MNVLILCGVFASENQQQVIDHAKVHVEFSANIFQQRLVEGFRSNFQTVSVISAPFIGSYPNASDIRHFRGFENQQTLCQYVSFHNLWGYRNYSRIHSLKKALRSFIDLDESDKLLVVYSAHTPFLNAAAYAKKKDPRIHTCFYVPDLPAYMNLNSNRSKFYDFAKTIDIRQMEKCMGYVDSYVLLTPPMKQKLPVGDKPCLIAEGILPVDTQFTPPQKRPHQYKDIVYTGKLNERFGVPYLLEAFHTIPDKNCRLVLCGCGDCDKMAQSAAKKDSRIILTGQVSPEIARQLQQNAAVLVNPRPNNEEYTKYSFPSKTLDYLITGNPVVAYMLQGMPKDYERFLYPIQNNLPPVQAISCALRQALDIDETTHREKFTSFRLYAKSSLTADIIAKKIVAMANYGEI